MTMNDAKPDSVPENAIDGAADIAVNPEPVVNDLDPIESLTSEITALKEQVLRCLADQENLRKRMARELDDARVYAITGFARDLLSVSDNLARALDSVKAQDAITPDAIAAFIQGVEMTEKEILTVFERVGIQKIHPLGDRFNHEHHQAMFELESDQPPQTVVQVLQSGYVLKNRLLRPAMVGVSKGPETSSGDCE